MSRAAFYQTLPRNSYAIQVVPRCSLIAFYAIERKAKHALTAKCSRDPRTRRPWRVVSYMLDVAAGQSGDPVSRLVRMVSGNGLHHLQAPNRERWSNSVYAGRFYVEKCKDLQA